MAQADLITPPPLRVVTPKPKMTIYYALLIISLVAMLTACLFLYLEIRRFGGFGTVPERIASIDRTELLFLSAAIPTDCHSAAAGSACRALNSRSRSNRAAGSSFTSWNL